MKTAFTLLIVCFFSYSSFAQPGTLDSSFGENGQVITTFDKANVTVVKGLFQKDNKIIVVGKYESALPPYNGFIAIRYMPDGLIDSSFGDGGKTIISDPSQDLIPLSACLQTDGKILIAGHGLVGLFPPVYTGVIGRLNTDGMIDSSFGINGTINNKDATYSSITIQPNGKIIVLGGASNSGFINRLLDNGSPDISFGTNSFVFFTSSVFTCKIQQNGKIVLRGGYRSTRFIFKITMIVIC